MGSSVLSLCAQVSKLQALALDTNLSAFDPQAFADGLVCIFFFLTTNKIAVFNHSSDSLN